MLYIIGGAPRSGKSLISRDLAKKDFSRFSTDFIVTMLQEAVPNLGIKHGLPFIPKAEKLWPFVEALCGHVVKDKGNFVLEGDAILPKQIDELKKNSSDNIKVCFLGFTDIDPKEKLSLIREYENLPDEWTSKNSDEEVSEYIDEMIEYSNYLKEECMKFGFKYIEVGNDLNKVKEEIDEFFG